MGRRIAWRGRERLNELGGLEELGVEEKGLREYGGGERKEFVALTFRLSS